ncbi:MAG: cytochrome c oxidase assembly protein [Limisphaerales bacterium]
MFSVPNSSFLQSPSSLGVVSFLLLFAIPSSALAHAGPVDLEKSIWLKWNLDWHLLVSLSIAIVLFSSGVRTIWERNGRGRGILVRQTWTFALGMFALFVALVSPLDALSAELSSAHMVQHMILMNVAAPLLVMSSPALAFSWALPQKRRLQVSSLLHTFNSWRPQWYRLWQPVFLWLTYGLTLWVWHLPALYQAALRNQGVHELQHICFFVVSCVFWRVLLDPLKRLKLNRAWGIFYLFATSLHATLLGVFMALSPKVWYPDYEATVASWNFSAIEDQQLAGLIMWMPACAVYALVAAFLFATWLQEPEQQPTTA